MAGMTETARALVLRTKPDTELLDSALRGDALAFSEVFRRYEPRVRGYCLARLLSADSAQDASQEVFVRLLAAEPGSVRALAPWLFGVARHVCIDVARRDNGREVVLGDDLEQAADGHAVASAEERMLSRGEAADVMLALRRIRPRYRTALVMREIHHLPMREVAEALGVNEGAAYTVISRSRDAFGKAYSEVLGLPAECAFAVEAIYRKTGSGLGAAEQSRLDRHLESCERCRREEARSNNQSGFAAVLPFLPALSLRGKGAIAQAMAAFGDKLPALQTAATYSPVVQPALVRTAAVVLAGTVAVGAGAAATTGALSQRGGSAGDEGVAQRSRAEIRAVGADSSTDATGPILARTRTVTGEQFGAGSGPAAGQGRGTGSGAGQNAAAPGHGLTGTPDGRAYAVQGTGPGARTGSEVTGGQDHGTSAGAGSGAGGDSSPDSGSGSGGSQGAGSASQGTGGATSGADSGQQTDGGGSGSDSGGSQQPDAGRGGATRGQESPAADNGAQSGAGTAGSTGPGSGPGPGR